MNQIKKQSRKNDVYVIDYYLNGIVKETINKDNPKNKFITNFTIQNLKQSTHKSGKLIKRKII